MERSMPDWSSGLPPELLEIIGKRLASGTDAASFRSVCTPWCAAIPFKSFAPLLLPPFDPDSEAVTAYSVAEDKTLSLPLPPEARGKVPCGTSCGWLALMDEAASVTLLNLFTGARVELPPADENVAAASSMLVSKQEDGRWVLHPEDDYEYEDVADAIAIALDDTRQVFFDEIVLSAPPDADGRGCVAMAVLVASTEVAFCRVGVDTAWTLVETYLDCSVDSVVLAIDCAGDISICSNDIADPGAPTATPMPSLSPPEDLCNRRYLEWNGELYVVGAKLNLFWGLRIHDYCVVVHRCSNLLDPTPAWSRVKDAGDLTLFMSTNVRHSFGGTSVSRFKRNSVYFSDPPYQNYLGHTLEISNIATRKSEVTKSFHPNVQGFEALCWIRTNLWRGRRGDAGPVEIPQEQVAPGPAPA